MSKYPLELIVWDDHSTFTTCNWRPLKESKSLGAYRINTVGFVIKETKKRVVVAATISETESTLGELCILKGTIVSREKLGSITIDD